MIRINLLPSGKKKAIVVPPVLIYGAIATVILIIVSIVLIFYLNRQISRLEEDMKVKEQKMVKLEATLKKVANYERDNEEFRKKSRIINQLKKNQILPLRLLDEVSGMLPEGVWLSTLTDNRGSISIEGYAFSNADLVGYVQNLKNSKYLKDIMLVESKQEVIEDIPVYNFKLTFRISL